MKPEDYKQWYIKNKERHLSNMKEYNRCHQEENKERVNKWRKENPEKLREAGRRWYKNRREAALAGSKARHKIKIPLGQTCELCGIKKATQRHHPNYKEPLRILFCCAKCNTNEKA